MTHRAPFSLINSANFISKFKGNMTLKSLEFKALLEH